MDIVPIDFREACLFVESHHRHHKAPIGHKFSIGLSSDGEIVGVAIIGRKYLHRVKMLHQLVNVLLDKLLVALPHFFRDAHAFNVPSF